MITRRFLKRYLKNNFSQIVRFMSFLGNTSNASSLFISLPGESDIKKASIMLCVPKKAYKTEDEQYLATRRLLNAVAYHISEDTKWELSFELKQKKESQ